MERYICIHGHFYQPPRENPWLEIIELQDSAYPYHDWNERITSECYSPNATSRILDQEGWILRIVNNYANISFDFGPTLLSWLETHAADVYEALLEADRVSQKRFSGHGSALAQPYNHMILPLANRRDKYTQTVWGIRDFEKRFGRSPEGMWLPETAVDLDSLEILAELGILFTILSPRQASRVRPLDGGEWEDVSGSKIDPTRPYWLKLASGRTIALFFYDAPISHAIAFESLLSKGDSFVQRLLGGLSETRRWPQILHVATDGETYGHHFAFGDMTLAYAIKYIESDNLVQLINYGEYLEKYPPTHEVEIFENTSWSCVHGVKRWCVDCGCNSGGHPGWSQAWRAPLRQAFDWLRDTLAPAYERRAGLFLKDPWRARNEYIGVVLDRTAERIEKFLREQAIKTLTKAEKITVLKLLELQRHTMLMYTSCGWFFDELSGIETVQVIQYAGRALQLAREVFGNAIEYRFLELLGEAKSNLAERGNGRLIFEKFVRPAVLDLEKVGAHYAVSSLFEEHEDEARIFCYKADQEEYKTVGAGNKRLAIGRVKLTSELTGESDRFNFGVLHAGDHNLSCFVRKCEDKEAIGTIVEEVSEPFSGEDLSETLQILEKRFGKATYSLMSLFRDEQRKILDSILQLTLVDTEATCRQMYEDHKPLLRFLKIVGNPVPKPLYSAAEFYLNTILRRAFEARKLDLKHIQNLLEEASLAGILLDSASLEMAMRIRIEDLAERFLAAPTDPRILEELNDATDMIDLLPFQVNTRKVQNICYEMLQSSYADLLDKTKKDDKNLRSLANNFIALSKKLSIRTA